MRQLLAVCVLLLSGLALAQDPQPKFANNTEYQTSFVLFPADTNAVGTGFGGKLLSEMDRTAGITMRRFLYDSDARDAVTVGIDDVCFVRAAQVKDLLVVKGKITKVGNKTATIYVTIERERPGPQYDLLVKGTFTFCAMKEGFSTEHGLRLKN